MRAERITRWSMFFLFAAGMILFVLGRDVASLIVIMAGSGATLALLVLVFKRVARRV